MAAPLTPTQRRVLDFLREFAERHRFAPTAADIAGRFGIAVKNGFYYLELLERKGYIRRKRHHPRRIEFVGENLSRSAVRIPVLGRVPAGGPREAIGEGEVFSLRVKGDSMTGAHICDGDHVVVRSQARAEEGEIVVAVIDGAATVKRFRRWKGKVRLEAANPAYPPIIVPVGAPSFRIAGKVVGVYRKL
jgi:repressor LexA